MELELDPLRLCSAVALAAGAAGVQHHTCKPLTKRAADGHFDTLTHVQLLSTSSSDEHFTLNFFQIHCLESTSTYTIPPGQHHRSQLFRHAKPTLKLQ